MFKSYTLKIGRYIVGVFERLVLKERSPNKLAASFCVGLYISFSPFLFLHTVMVLVFAWFFSLNLPAVWAGAFVNNPWTMIPCHTAGYVVGEFFLGTICRVDSLALNPSWMSIVNEPLFRYTGINGVSFWSFMIGGNLLGIALGAMLYPVFKRMFNRLSARVYSGARKTVMANHENRRTKQKSIPRLRNPRSDRSGDRTDR